MKKDQSADIDEALRLVEQLLEKPLTWTEPLAPERVRTIRFSASSLPRFNTRGGSTGVAQDEVFHPGSDYVVQLKIARE